MRSAFQIFCVDDRKSADDNNLAMRRFTEFINGYSRRKRKITVTPWEGDKREGVIHERGFVVWFSNY